MLKQLQAIQLVTIIGVLFLFSMPLGIAVAQQDTRNTTTATRETSGLMGNQIGQEGNETQQGGPLEQLGVNERLANEFAYNGTSFDGYLKEKAIPEYGKDYLLSTVFNQSVESEMMKAVTICMSPLGQAIAETICDFAVSGAYEVCQALPEAMFICASPDIGTQLANRNITEGQTDKMAWLFFSKIGALATQ
jgi:hypothetical protein